MNAVDTNVFVYALDRYEPIKRPKARRLLRQLHVGKTPTILLWQVASEFLARLRTWQLQRQLSANLVELYLRHYMHFFPLSLPTAGVLSRSLVLSKRFSLSHWDSMLLGACQEAGVTTLYTEDMGAPQTIDTIQLVNPF